MIVEHIDFFTDKVAHKMKEELLKLNYESGEVDREYVEPVGKSADVENDSYIYKTLIGEIEDRFPQVKNYNLFRVFVNLFEPGDLPYFHKDATQGNGVTFIYYPLDKEWKLDDRGETEIFEGKERKSIIPFPNRLLEFDGRLLHRANSFRDRDRYTLVAQYKW